MSKLRLLTEGSFVQIDTQTGTGMLNLVYTDFSPTVEAAGILYKGVFISITLNTRLIFLATRPVCKFAPFFSLHS